MLAAIRVGQEGARPAEFQYGPAGQQYGPAEEQYGVMITTDQNGALLTPPEYP